MACGGGTNRAPGKVVSPVIRVLLAIVSSLVWACAAGSGPVLIEVSDGSAAIDDFVAIVTMEDGHIITGECPHPSGAELECGAGGLRIDDLSGDFLVTVKARGYHFADASFAYSELPGAGDQRRAEVVVTAVPAFTANDDYATGIAVADGVTAFADLAMTVDTDLGPGQVVKFYIRDLAGAPQLYLQNTRLHPLHYEFARDVLALPVTRAQFEAATYSGSERSAMAGTLVRYPATTAQSAAIDGQAAAPIALSFFPSDDLSAAQALHTQRFIEERLGIAALSGGDSRLVYVPAGSVQEALLMEASASFASRGAMWMTHGELHGSSSLQLLNDGLAYGTLKLLTPEELATAVVSFTDVLVLTRLPNQLPIVGGTITEELQTPLAHVNVAARTRGTPNIALVDASSNSDVVSLLGELVRFEVKDGSYTLAATTLTEAQAFWDSRNPEAMVPEHDDTLTGLPGFAEVAFADSLSVGVKAANLAELAHILAERAPHGFAVPFHYYYAFMSSAQVSATLCAEAGADCVAEGRAAALCDRAVALCVGPDAVPELLRDHVDRLIADAQVRSDAELREAVLNSIRYHINHIPVAASFAAALDARVAEVFGSARVRIRSSTNTEDLANFSGAGLYRSVGAYASGAEAASLRIRKVWASVFSWRAFEERSFWNIDHAAVRMGCAVNQAFIDEAANGVLITSNISNPTVAGLYVNVQLGEVSVTNPEHGALAEIFAIVPAPDGGIQVARERFSSLSPAAPILATSEVVALARAVDTVQNHFATLYEVDPRALVLDLEFKFTAPDRALVFKQARPYTNND